MKNKTLIICTLFFTFAISINAQDSSKPTIVKEPAKILITPELQNILSDLVFGEEFEYVKKYYLTTPANLNLIRKSSAKIRPCQDEYIDNFIVIDSTDGFFISKNFKTTAYLYKACDKKNDYSYQGIIVLRRYVDRKNNYKDDFFAHFAYDFKNDISLSTLQDINNNSLDEIAVHSLTVKPLLTRAVTIFEISKDEIVKLGFRDLWRYGSSPHRKSNLFVEKKSDGAPVFYVEDREMTAAGWGEKSVQEIKLDEDQTIYVKGGWNLSLGILDLAFGTLILQAILFVILLPVTLYAMFRGITTPAETNKTLVENTSSTAAQKFPALKPLNCPACGAGVPLRDENMSCPSCQTSFPVPKEYEEIRLFRNDIAKNLKSATSYWNWATFLTSRLISCGIFLLSIWLIVSPVIIGFAENKGNKLFYVHLFGSKFFGLAVLAWLFWIFTLFLMSGMISPRTRKLLPTLEKTENISKAENGNCSQCGGAIQYSKSDIATVCGYCGIETYRGKIAWKVRNAVNDVRQKASFSLIEAMAAFREAVDDIIYTPIILIFILVILPALLFGVFYVLDLIGVTDLIDFLDRLF